MAADTGLSLLSRTQPGFYGVQMDLREQDIILAETVKLLNVSVGASNRASQLIAKFFMKVTTLLR